MGRHNKSRRHDADRHHGLTRGGIDRHGQGGYYPPMSYNDYYPNGNPPTQYSDYSRPPHDYEYQSYGAPGANQPPTKDDFEKVRQRNFEIWAKWRAGMNDSILSDFEGGAVRPMPPLEAAMQEDDPNPSSQYDPNMLMNYSVCTNSVTDLESDEFLKFGIPRAKLNTKNLEYRDLFSANGDRHVRMETKNGKENMYIVRMQPV